MVVIKGNLSHLVRIESPNGRGHGVQEPHRAPMPNGCWAKRDANRVITAFRSDRCRERGRRLDKTSTSICIKNINCRLHFVEGTTIANTISSVAHEGEEGRGREGKGELKLGPGDEPDELLWFTAIPHHPTHFVFVFSHAKDSANADKSCSGPDASTFSKQRDGGS